MAKTTGKPPSSGAQSSYATWGYATIDANGIAPDSRVPTANDAYVVSTQLKNDNARREQFDSRIYKCYKGFPPNDYSRYIAENKMAMSNVPFNQMRYRVNSKKSPFFDMVMQKPEAASILTKVGNERERKIYGDLISQAFNKALWRWDSYLYNTQLTLDEMLLYGKGFELAETRDGWPTKSLHNYQFLIPERTEANLCNLGELVVRRSYTPIQFWEMLTGGNNDPRQNEENAKKAGWNFWACVNALRYYTSTTKQYKTIMEYYEAVAGNGFNLSRIYNIRIDVYEMYVKEFDGSISKMLILQNYMPIIDSYNASARANDRMSEEKGRESMGYLFYKKNWVEKTSGMNVWNKLIIPFMCSSGSGWWHETQGFAQGIYTQCRAFDIHMNRTMDAVDVNNMFMLQGGSADATKKMKQMEWQKMFILPQDVQPIQHRFEMPIGENLQFMQFYTSEMDRGTATYRMNAPTADGKQRTRGEAELDAAESSQIEGTEQRSFNHSFTLWYRLLYNRMVNCSRRGEGYQIFEEFKQFLADNKVPEEAWQEDGIDTIDSILLGGQGSKSFKVMAADKLIQYTNITPSSPGQLNAVQDAIAVYAGRQNVDRYMPDQPEQIPDQARVIGFENSGMDDPTGNIENFRVFPSDNHLVHMQGHFSDAMKSCDKADAMLQQQADPEEIAEIAFCIMNLKMPHMGGHLQFIQKDPTKEEVYKKLTDAMNVLQRRVNMIANDAKQMLEQKQQQSGTPQGASPEEVKVQTAAALAGIKVQQTQQTSNIKLASLAEKHDLAMQQKKEKAAVDTATKLLRAKQDAALQRQRAATDATVRITDAAHNAIIKDAEAQQDLQIKKKEAAVKAKKKPKNQ